MDKLSSSALGPGVDVELDNIVLDMLYCIYIYIHIINNKGKKTKLIGCVSLDQKLKQTYVNLMSQITDLVIYNQTKHTTLACASLPTFTCLNRMPICKSNFNY